MADLQFTVSALDKTAATLLKVAAQLEKVGDKLDKLDGKVARIAVALEGDKKAVAGLDNVERKVRDLDGKKATIKVGIDKTFGDTLVQINMVAKALKAISLPAAAIAAAPQLAALGAAAVETSGALLLLPAAGLAAGAAIGTLAVAFNDFGTALYQGTSAKKIKEANEALAAMGPQARSAALAIRDLKTPFEELRKIVQERFFAGMGAEIKQLGSVYFPVLKSGMAGIATEMNKSARGFMDWAKSASTVSQVSTIFTATRLAVHELAPAVTNVAAGFLDMGVVGSKYLLALAAHASVLTARFREWVTQAKESGKLDEWIQTGIVKVQQLGSIVGNVGSILMSAFHAASTSGADFLGTVDRITAGIANFLKSGEGQGAIVALFKEIRATVDALEPGVKAVGSAIAYMIAQIAQSGTLHDAAGALSAMAISVAPLAKTLVDLATTILPPVLQLISAIAPVLGPVVAGFLAWSLAARGLGAVQGMLTGLAVKMSDVALNAGVMTEKLTGSANAGEKVATSGQKVADGFSRMGAALPILGIGIAAIGLAYEEFGGKADSAAQKVINGSLSMQQAIKQEGDQIHRNQIEWLGGMNAQESYAAASVNVRAELDKQLALLSPMARLQAEVAMAQTALNDAVVQFGPKSAEAQAAAANLAGAKDRLRQASTDAAAAEKTLGDQIVETSRAASAAANADVAYQQSLLSLRDAQDRAAEAARNHGAGSRELEQANLAVMQANLSAADAARRKAEADAVATGATNSAQIGAQAYKDELIRLAGQATGPTREALLAMANGTDVAKQSAATAEIQSRLYKDELGRLAGQANGPLAEALRNAQTNFGNLGGAHATAEQKAAAQKAELQRLADMASGPVKRDLQAMADQIRTLPDGDFTVSGTGEVRGVRSVGGTFAAGGVLPGYTPGRDVHRFTSATGGTLDLSGGEAVMRPEWTRAVGPGYVNAANSAARSGGLSGAQRFARGGYADGGIINGLPHQRLAMGGDIRLGGVQPFVQIPRQAYDNVLSNLVKSMVSTIKGMIASAMAAAAAALGGGAGGGGSVSAGGARGWIIAHESGGNPRAQNPTSTASGLYQMINGTWRAYGGSTARARDASVAEQNAVADRYVAARYGSWEGAVRFWQAHHWYDRGGYLMPGATLAMNATGQRERVLSPSETRLYDQPRGSRSGDVGALLTTMQRLIGEVHALRGDVDHHGDNAGISARLDVANQLLAGLGAGGGVAMSAQRGRVVGDLGPF